MTGAGSAPNGGCLGLLVSANMESELNSLDDRIQQLIRVAERLRSENGELRQQLAASLSEGKLLRDRMTAARLRLEGVLTRLPADSE